MSLDESGTGPNGRAEVVLVLMPYARLEHPSIALGLLRAALTRRGISSAVVYANLLLAEEVGVDLVQLVNHGSRGDLNGEWTFRRAAFPEHRADHRFYLERAARAFCGETRSALDADELASAVVRQLERLHELAPRFVDRIARLVLARRPRVVACSSTFEQHVASLALLRRVRELAPDVVTVIGGANCEAEMGVATAREFPWVDIAFSGEADDAFAPLCEMLIRRGRHFASSDLPAGAIDRRIAESLSEGGRCSRTPPRTSVLELDATPVPDYDDYFATLARMPYGDAIRPGLQIETSRGCWWGAIKHCTFCGLNGGSMAYRSKSPDRVVAELDELASRYRIEKFAVVDNILDMDYLESVLPRIAASESEYRLFFETKANLKREQVRLLRDAGVHWIQPGIEALDDRLLRLMDKGCSAATNVQLLKYASEFGLYVIWNFLGGFPGEDDRWHAETAALVPLLHHLQPPKKAFRVRFDRFSVYHSEPERFGLELVPFDSYADVFPVSPTALTDLAYFFKDARDAHETHDSLGIETVDPPGIEALQQSVHDWQRAAMAREPARLSMRDDGAAIDIVDTRPCAPARTVRLEGLAAAVYRRCEPAIPRQRLVAELTRADGAGGAPSAADVEACIASLLSAKLLADLHGKLLALAVSGDPLAPPRARDFAGGHTRVASPSRLAALDREIRTRRERAPESAPHAEREAPTAP